MRTFELFREEDETGISGVGKVLEGIVFSDGTCVTRWVSDSSTGRSTAVWDSVGAFLSIHVTPHPHNKTKLQYSDGEVQEYGDKPKKRRKAKEAAKK